MQPRIFHFNGFVPSLDVDRFIRDNTILYVILKDPNSLTKTTNIFLLLFYRI